LDQVLAEKKSLRERLSLLPHLIAACEAMAYAHAQKIIHRDLKPQNVLLGAFGETVVIDWGLAKDLAADSIDATPEESSRVRATSGGLTQDGAILGTPAYMPPEQAMGEPVDERADVYALGAFLYHLLAGQPPYPDKRVIDILKQLVAQPPPTLESLVPKAPRD